MVTVSGIVLAGGRSARFGRDKLAEPIDGLPMLHRAVLGVVRACEEVVVVTAFDGPEPSLPDGVKVTVVRDAVPDGGPLVGAAAGLASAAGEIALLVGGDMPDLRPSVLRELVRVAVEDPVEAVVLHDDESFRPLPCALRIDRAREAAEERLTAGDRSLYALLNSLRLAMIDEATWRALDPEGRTLHDVDEPGDLRERPGG